MNKIIKDIQLHLRAMWKYKWLGLLTAWGIAVAATCIVFMMPKKYEASARVFVNTDSILKPLMQGMTVQPEIDQRVALLSKLIISRPNVDQLIRQTGLDAKVKTQEQREKLIDTVMKVLDIQGSGDKDNIYVLKFKDTNPERAKHMIELLLAKFMQAGTGNNDTEAAEQFLDAQTDVYEKKLQEAESRLKEFKLQNMAGLVPGDGKDQVAQLGAVGDQLEQARLQLKEAENSRDAFRRGLAGEDIATAPAPGVSVAGGESIADIDARIDAMKRNLDGLLQKYTESHPDVVGARRVIADLQAQRSKMAAEYRKAGVPLVQAATTGPRASEQLKVSLAQAEASVASLRARVAEYSERYSRLREAVRRMPEYEAQLAQLNRDYETNKKNYENLVTRRESASIAGDMQSVAGVADFRLIDPPRISPNAVSPSRSVMLLGAMLFSLAAGIGVMFLAKEIRPGFYDRSQLYNVTGLPIIGVVSLVESDQMRAKERKRFRLFVQAASVMACLYVVIVVSGLLLTKATA